MLCVLIGDTLDVPRIGRNVAGSDDSLILLYTVSGHIQEVPDDHGAGMMDLFKCIGRTCSCLYGFE